MVFHESNFFQMGLNKTNQINESISSTNFSTFEVLFVLLFSLTKPLLFNVLASF